MFTHATEEDNINDTSSESSLLTKLSKAYSLLWYRWKIRKSNQLLEEETRLASIKLKKFNKLFDSIEEQKYYLIQRHRCAVAALHQTPKASLIDRQFFTTMNAVAAIDKTGQTAEQKLEHQRIALRHGMLAIKRIINGQVPLDD